MKTQRKECTYKNEKYKVTVKERFDGYGKFYEVVIRRLRSFCKKTYIIDIKNSLKEAVEKAFKYYDESQKKYEQDEKEIQDFKLWNGVIEQCST